jgi:hypothetical protein
VVDWLRSCYSTRMVLDQLGGSYNVDWFFVPPATPLLGFPCFSSLNWVEPEYGTINLGEDPFAARPYSKGTRPAYAPTSPTWPVTGNPLDFSGGAAAPLSAPPPLDWAGRRWVAPALRIFPPFPGAAPTPTLTDPGHVVLAGGWSGTAWGWLLDGARNINWAPTDAIRLASGYWDCFVPPYITLSGLAASLGQYLPLRCTSYDSSTGISHWDDPSGLVLGAGEALTLASV